MGAVDSCGINRNGGCRELWNKEECRMHDAIKKKRLAGCRQL
jgi:hypothetical protein